MDKQLAIKPKRKAKSGNMYQIAGVTKDGVKILKMPGRATHFTDKEISDAVRAVLSRAKRGGSAAIAKSLPSKKG